MIIIRISGKESDAPFKVASKMAAMYQIERKVVRKYEQPNVPETLPTDADVIIIVTQEA